MSLIENKFSFRIPTKIVFGADETRNLKEHILSLNGSKIIIVTDPGIREVGLLDIILEPIIKGGFQYSVFDKVEREPDVSNITEATEKAKDFGADIVIGIGGGSALDAAKSVGVMVNNEGVITDYSGLNNIPNKGIPTICIPTTSGTGSEVTIWVVISNKKENMKYGVGGNLLAPDIAICDPKLTMTLPPGLTAATGLDALTHALESFVNKATQPISEALSREAMKLLSKSLRKAVLQGDNLEARSDVLLASTMAALAFNSTRLGLAHALCMPLGGKYKIPHGIANAILLPSVMEFNLPGNLEKFKEIAEIFGENTEGLSLNDAAYLSVKAIKQLNSDISIPPNLSSHGVTEDDLEYIAKEGILSGNVIVNPRKATIEDLKSIVRKLI